MSFRSQISKIFTTVESSNIHSYYQCKPGAPVYVIFKSGWGKVDGRGDGLIYQYTVDDVDEYSFKEEIKGHGSVGKAVQALKELCDNSFDRVYYSAFLDTVKKPVDPAQFVIEKPVPETDLASWM